MIQSIANTIEYLQEIFQHLLQYKARSVMTMFGIIWGTLTVILLLSFGMGVKKQMSINMHGIGEGLVIVWPGRTSIPFYGYGRDRRIRLDEDDIEMIRSEVKDIIRISPEYNKWGSIIRVGDQINRPNIAGVIPEYAFMRSIAPESGGRWLDELDLKYRRRVVFIGNKLRDFLFGENANAIGKFVYIDETPFMVIGVMRPKTQTSSYSQRDQDRVFIPMTTHKALFGNHYLDNFIYQIDNPSKSESVRKQVYTTVGKKFKFDPNDKETLGIWDTTEFDKFIFAFSLGFNIFMGMIGVITLVVGGIGLANIMYVVVQERTREIGILRSVGAKRRNIFGQFMLEAFVVIGIGAFIGFVIAMFLIWALNALPFQDFKDAVGVPIFNPLVALLTVIILGSIGFLAGFFPARRAARLNVIDCLRF
jgi:putative ABC transport system permease protein